MVDGSLDQDPDGDAPKSRGSEAVERRIEKLISELNDLSGAMEVTSEREFEAKKVKFRPLSVIAWPHTPPLPNACRFSPIHPLDKEIVRRVPSDGGTDCGNC
jgi:hypothetical protein